MHIPITRLDPSAPLPSQAHDDDAGYDLHANEAAVIPPNGGRALVPTGLAVAIPSGYAGLVLPRSGLARRHGVTLTNAPGLIDAGYRGEVKVLLLNTDAVAPFSIAVGDRIAQLVIVALPGVEPAWVDSLPETARGEGGFGSTGTS